MQFRLRVIPEAKHEVIHRAASGEFHIFVKQPAKRDLATKRALKLLADHLQVPQAHVKIIAGRRAEKKLVHVRPPSFPR